MNSVQSTGGGGGGGMSKKDSQIEVGNATRISILFSIRTRKEPWTRSTVIQFVNFPILGQSAECGLSAIIIIILNFCWGASEYKSFLLTFQYVSTFGYLFFRFSQCLRRICFVCFRKFPTKYVQSKNNRNDILFDRQADFANLNTLM